MKTTHLRNEITSFAQYDGESLYKTWERFKKLLHKCQHHSLLRWLQIQTFYNGLSGGTHSSIDVVAGGSFMGKTEKATYNLLEEILANNYQWLVKRLERKRQQCVYEINALASINAMLDTLVRRLDKMGMQNCSPNSVVVCEICDSRHEIVECQVGSPFCPFETSLVCK